jgi:hypothetical protein
VFRHVKYFKTSNRLCTMYRLGLEGLEQDKLKAGDESVLFQLLTAALKCNMYFLLWNSQREDGQTLDVHDQYMKIINLVTTQVTNTLDTYPQGDPRVRTIIR